MANELAKQGNDETIWKLETQRNELAPISQLPAEILGMIFGFAVQDNPAEVDDFPALFNFSYVSRSWRWIALNTPRLWSLGAFPIRRRKWATAILERSKMAPLTIRASTSTAATPNHDIAADDSNRIPTGLFLKDVHVLHNHISHIQELQLETTHPIFITSVLEDMPTHAPLLQLLHLSADRYENRDPWCFITLPVGLLTGKGALRILRLQSVNIDWKTISFLGLVHLEIDYCYAVPLLSEFVNALQQMSTLISLDLHRALPSESDFETAAATFHNVTLPKLRLLRLNSTFIEVVNVLTLISVPMMTTLEIVCTSAPEDEMQALRFSSALATLVSIAEYSDLKTWSDIDSDGSLSLRLTARSTARTDTDKLRRLILSIECSGTSTCDMLLLQVLPGLSLTHLRKMYLKDPGFEAATLIEAFGSLPILCHVSVQGSCLLTFVEALGYKKENFNTSLPAFLQVSFPTVTSLRVHQGDFSDEYEDGMAAEDFQDMLMERCERQAPLEMLSLTRSYGIESSAVQLMREIVVEVAWDGFQERDAFEEQVVDEFGSEDDVF